MRRRSAAEVAIVPVCFVLLGSSRGRSDPRRSLFENPVKLPFLNIELPLLAFFLAPILFLIVHAYTLVHLVMLTDKAKRFDQCFISKLVLIATCQRTN